MPKPGVLTYIIGLADTVSFGEEYPLDDIRRVERKAIVADNMMKSYGNLIPVVIGRSVDEESDNYHFGVPRQMTTQKFSEIIRGIKVKGTIPWMKPHEKRIVLDVCSCEVESLTDNFEALYKAYMNEDKWLYLSLRPGDGE